MSRNGRNYDEAGPVLRCPVCGAGLMPESGQALACPNRHSFDRAKQGYFNLMPRPAGTKYDKNLFRSRRIIHQAGLWDPMLDAVAEPISMALPRASQPALLLDAGCGEGSPLAGLSRRLDRKGVLVRGVGVDLAKDGVLLAAKTYKDQAWYVGDLARTPFAGRSFDVVFNMLTPANYAEFARILKTGGLLVKVVPNPDYLMELRSLREGRLRDKSGGAEQAAMLFDRAMKDVRRERVRYEFPLPPGLAEHMIRMTPMAWHAGREELLHERLQSIGRITVDLTLLCGRNR